MLTAVVGNVSPLKYPVLGPIITARAQIGRDSSRYYLMTRVNTQVLDDSTSFLIAYTATAEMKRHCDGANSVRDAATYPRKSKEASSLSERARY